MLALEETASLILTRTLVQYFFFQKKRSISNSSHLEEKHKHTQTNSKDSVQLMLGILEFRKVAPALRTLGCTAPSKPRFLWLLITQQPQGGVEEDDESISTYLAAVSSRGGWGQEGIDARKPAPHPHWFLSPPSAPPSNSSSRIERTTKVSRGKQLSVTFLFPPASLDSLTRRYGRARRLYEQTKLYANILLSLTWHVRCERRR